MKKIFQSAKIICLVAVVFGMTHTAKGQITEWESIKCFGDSIGKLVAMPGFGTTPYTYLWNTGESTRIISELKAGVYTVTITDSAGLGTSIPFSHNLTQPQPISAIYNITANSTWPANNGIITINASGGTGWYIYTVYDSTARDSVKQTNKTFNRLASGYYKVTISDMYDCKYEGTAKVNELAPYTGTLTIDSTACYISSAPISVVPDTLGIVPVTLIFDTTKTTIKKIISGASPFITSDNDTLSTIDYEAYPGWHIVTVYTGSGRGFRHSWYVDSILTPVKLSWLKTDIICYGNSTGAISAAAEGSWDGYRFTITAPGFSDTSAAVTGLAAGAYNIHVEDSTGCGINQTVIIEQPEDSLRVVAGEIKHSRCPFTADGSIEIRRVDVASLPLTYVWSNGNNNNTADSLRPGVYTVSITDANNCIAVDSFEIKPLSGSCIYNVVTPNGDGYNDYLDLSELAFGMEMEAIIIHNKSNRVVAKLDETNPTWDASDSGNSFPTGSDSNYTVFIKLYNKGVLYKEFPGETFSVIR